jgi:hypothetical protein
MVARGNAQGIVSKVKNIIMQMAGKSAAKLFGNSKMNVQRLVLRDVDPQANGGVYMNLYTLRNG